MNQKDFTGLLRLAKGLSKEFLKIFAPGIIGISLIYLLGGRIAPDTAFIIILVSMFAFLLGHGEQTKKTRELRLHIIDHMAKIPQSERSQWSKILDTYL